MGSLDGKLAGKAAVVTGAASGIGAAVAVAYAAEGATLLLADRDRARAEATAERCRGTGAKAVAREVDVTDERSTRDMVGDAIAELGAVHVLVNCAGILTEVPLVEMDVATWDEMIATDLRSVFLCCRWAVPHMVERRWGRVVNIASQLGIKGGESLVHYSAAKAGVIGLTKALAREVAPYGVLVNAIAPGPIETPLTAGISDEWRAAKRAELPLGRFGVPKEVAPTAVLLASDPGGNLYVGQTLGPNSGDVMP
ncbi:MAG: SDR family NAD(P)-dependent oxidoreductase [Streptosporangiaceae bacterium]